MATQQVKFHKVVSASFAGNSANPGDLYFVTATADSKYGELFKGDVRIGAARITEIDYEKGTDDTYTLTVPGAVRGDINISARNGAEVLGDDGKWKGLSDASLTKRVEDIETVVKAGDKAVDGKSVVTANKVSATDVVATTVSAATVSAATVSATDVSATTVSATDGYFTNLTVSDTASFNATTVEATTLSVATEDGATFGGKTVAAIADDRIAAIAAVTKSATDDGITVSVKTESGSVSEVQLEVAGATTAAEFTSEATKVATAKGVKAYVDETLKDINGAMRFYGTTTATAASDIATDNITKASTDLTATQAGDVVVNTTTGKEYLNTASGWVEIGDEGKIAELVTYTGLADKANLGKNGDATIASIGGADDLTEAINNVGASVDAIKTTLTGGTSEDSAKGVAISVVTASGTAAPTVDVEVTLTAVSDGSTDEQIPSAKAVYSFVTGVIDGLDATVSAMDAAKEEDSVVAISVTETNGKLTDATVTVAKAEEIRAKDEADNAHLATEKAVRDAIDGLNEAITGGSSTSTDDHGVTVEVVTASVSAEPTVKVTVSAIESAASIVTTEKKVVTAGAVADLVASLDASVSSSTQTGLQVKVEETDGKLTSVTAELLWLGSDDTVLA